MTLSYDLLCRLREGGLKSGSSLVALHRVCRGGPSHTPKFKRSRPNPSNMYCCHVHCTSWKGGRKEGRKRTERREGGRKPWPMMSTKLPQPLQPDHHSLTLSHFPATIDLAPGLSRRSKTKSFQPNYLSICIDSDPNWGEPADTQRESTDQQEGRS